MAYLISMRIGNLNRLIYIFGRQNIIIIYLFWTAAEATLIAVKREAGHTQNRSPVDLKADTRRRTTVHAYNAQLGITN